MRLKRYSLLAAASLLWACAGTATQLPDISAPTLRAENLLQESRSLAVQSEQMERLFFVGRAILLANADLCPQTRRDIGVMLHTIDNYPEELKTAAQRELGATDIPTIFKIAPDSPADRAGLQMGDIILIDDKPVHSRSKSFQDALDADHVALKVKRNSETIHVTLAPDTVCHSRLQLRNSAAINASANGRSIKVMTGLMEFTQTDDELALIIGHELAHNTMGHIRKVVGNLLLSGFSTRYTRPFESEADYVGLYYMVRAGFSPDGVEDVWRRLANIDPRSVNRAKTHPTFPDRYVRIAAAREEILSKQAKGEPLLPNFKDD